MANLPLNQNKMESKIIKQEKNPFLEREEIVMEVISEVAPNSEEIKTLVGKDADLTVVKKIQGNFGKNVFVVDVVVYDNIEAKKKIETVPQKVRKKMEADRKSEEAAKKKAEDEAKKAEEEAKASEEVKVEETDAPVEEVKEEVKAEGESDGN
ncbi:hypothetical protein KAJ38_02385 [Candidatus Pacearchaeota archaeon]|nr:hypothetical protein [Candidatus Pacearchaeota archaeon]